MLLRKDIVIFDNIFEEWFPMMVLVFIVVAVKGLEKLHVLYLHFWWYSLGRVMVVLSLTTPRIQARRPCVAWDFFENPSPSRAADDLWSRGDVSRLP